jgi:hypothetical protein
LKIVSSSIQATSNNVVAGQSMQLLGVNCWLGISPLLPAFQSSTKSKGLSFGNPSAALLIL